MYGMGKHLSFLAYALCWISTVCWASNTDEQQALLTPQRGENGKQPNIVFILTDDQDLHMDSLSYMPHLQKHLVEQGTYYRRHYCTVALCCPSRATIWTGREAHNTNVTDVNPPYGGYPKFVSQGFNDAYLPIWLQEAGYNTYYTGKLFNAQSVVNYDKPFAKGWTGSDFLLDPYTYEYLNATFQRNHDPPVSYEGQYSTDVLLQKARGFLEDALADDKPFFLTIAPTAPHSNVNIRDNIIDNFTEHSVTQSPPIPADRHAHLFPDVVVPRTPHFNPDTPNSVSWISRLPHQNATVLASNDHWYRSRLRALQPVDEFLSALIARLASAGVLHNTYVVYTTDNGYHIGQHRLQPGKQCAIEEDLNVPLVVRGPGVPKGVSTGQGLMTSHVDLAGMFLGMAGVKGGRVLERYGLDGVGVPLTREEIEEAEGEGKGKRHEHVNVESWGIIMSEGKYGAVLYPNHTYKALRVVGRRYNFVYTVWCGGEHELYDLNVDPYQMANIHPEANGSVSLSDTITFRDTAASDPHSPPSPPSPLMGPHPPRQLDDNNHLTTATTATTASTTIAALLPRLDALLSVLKTCVGRDCWKPWHVLHPDGKVRTLEEALDGRYDVFYDGLEKVWSERCERGYVRESEFPKYWDKEESEAVGMLWEIDVGAGRRKGEEDGEKDRWVRTEL